MKRWGPLGALSLLLGAGALGWTFYQHQEAERIEAVKAAGLAKRRSKRKQAQIARKAAERSASAQLIPSVIKGVLLGQTVDEVKAVRPSLQSAKGGQKGLTWWTETLRNGSSVRYGFTHSLEQVQLMSQIPAAGLQPHLQAMFRQYGQPSGSWICPSTGGIPTWRFTWKKEHVGIQDIMLIHTGGISLTFYIAPNDVIGRSLQQSQCRPGSKEDMKRLPVLNQEQLQRAR